MSVLVDHGKIAQIVPAGKANIPGGALVIDGKGKFLIPGLNDMHAHDTWDAHFNGPLLLANGVTGVRDMFAYDLTAVQERRREVAAGALHPNIMWAGPIVDGDPPSWPHSIVVHNASEATRAVDMIKSKGWDFVKVYSSLSRESYFAIAQEAKRIGISFEGHVPESITASEASDAGQKTIAHLMDVAVSCTDDKHEVQMRKQAREAIATGSSQKVWLAQQVEATDFFSKEKCQALCAKFVTNQTWQVPTLAVERVNGGMTDPKVYNPPNMKYVPYLLKLVWESARNRIASSITPAQAIQYHRAFVDHLVRIVGEMHRAGVPIMTGTDNPNPFVIPGFSLHDELDYFVNAGFTPLEALQASTIMPAKFLGRTDTMGTVDVGKDANLVLLDADPLADIDNTRKIDAVVLNGQYISRPVLESLLRKAYDDRWYPHPAAVMLLAVVWRFAKYYVLGGLVVLAFVLGFGIYFLRHLLRRRRTRPSFI